MLATEYTANSGTTPSLLHKNSHDIKTQTRTCHPVGWHSSRDGYRLLRRHSTDPLGDVHRLGSHRYRRDTLHLGGVKEEVSPYYFD